MTQCCGESLETRTGSRVRGALNIAAVLIALALVVRLFMLINRMAIDTLFWDQYAYYTGIWRGDSMWKLFRWQHGPHRMGLGFPIMTWIDGLTDWNQRVQAFVVGSTMCLAGMAALWLKRRLTGSIAWHDVAIAFLFLTNLQWAMYADVINLSHGALPLLLLVCIGLCWTIGRPAIRYSLMAMLTVLATFTGFGIFACVVVPVMLLLRGVAALVGGGWRGARAEIAWIGVALLICGVGEWNFFHDYVFEPAVPGFVFPHPRPMEYLYFAALEFAYVLGGKSHGPGEIAYGVVILLAMLWAGMAAGVMIWRGRREYRPSGYVIAYLLAFSVIFAVNSAVGRVCTGLENALTSRYVPLLIPGLLGLYIAATLMPRPAIRMVLVGLLIATFAVGSTRDPKKSMVRHYVIGKTRWIAAYKETHSIHLADLKSGFQIFPDTIRFPIKQRLDWLEERKLSLFRE